MKRESIFKKIYIVCYQVHSMMLNIWRLFPILWHRAPKHYLSITAIVKNEGQYLKEWIEYHLLVGVEHFYIYDNESNDDTFEVLKPYLNLGVVDYFQFPGKAVQIQAYQDATRRFRFRTYWMAYIDADEFIVPDKVNTIPELLKPLENKSVGGLVVSWVLFDSNGHVRKPNGLVVESFRSTHSAVNKANLNVKTIARPCFVLFCDIHHCLYCGYFNAVDETGKVVHGPFNPMKPINTIRINHYWTKSAEEFRAKVDRGRADGGVKRNFDLYLDQLNFIDAEYDNIMDRFIPALRRRMDMQ